jgi:hypothetical protein
MVHAQRPDESPGESGCELSIHDDFAVVVEHLLVDSAACHDLRHRLGRIATYILTVIGQLDEGECDAAEEVPVLNAQGESSVCSNDGEEKEVLDVSSPEQSSQLSPTLVESVRHCGLETDLGIIAERCALKAEACRWAAERQGLIVGAATSWDNIQERDGQLIKRAKAFGNCYLWMCRPRESASSNSSQFEELARCFELLSQGALLVQQVHKDSALSKLYSDAAVRLLAEAQSALRVAVLCVNEKADIDQLSVFVWLKEFAAEKGIYIERYMRVSDPAAPEMAGELLGRVEEVRLRLEESQAKQKRWSKLLGKVRHKVSLIQREPSDREGNWQILVDTVAELLADRLPPSNRELRELLVPIIDGLPDDECLRERLKPVLCEIHRFRKRDLAPRQHIPVEPTSVVTEVARRLRNRSLVIIGGRHKADAHRAIKEAFGLHELDWVETKPHQALQRFEPHVARTGVAAVVLAIRWASHSFGGVKKFCQRYNVPFVRLTAGYSPNQLRRQFSINVSGSQIPASPLHPLRYLVSLAVPWWAIQARRNLGGIRHGVQKETFYGADANNV